MQEKNDQDISQEVNPDAEGGAVEEPPVNWYFEWDAKFGAAQVSVKGDMRIQSVQDLVSRGQEAIAVAADNARSESLFKNTLAETAKSVGPHVADILREKLNKKEGHGKSTRSFFSVAERLLGAGDLQIEFSPADGGKMYQVVIDRNNAGMASAKEDTLMKAWIRAVESFVSMDRE